MAMRAMQEATFMILTALADGAQHGYGIITDVRDISGGRVRLCAGTLYMALDRLRAEELIAVDHQEHLERAYRRLLAWYPREFRLENEQEILAVLLADAPDGQRRPGLAQSGDLIRCGLWMRLRPSVPRSARTVRVAIKLMYADGVVSTVNLVILLAVIADAEIYHAILGHRLTTTQLSRVSTQFITTFILWDLVPIAVWLWMARACGRGRNWARIASTVLFGLATLNLTSVLSWLPPGIHLTLVPEAYGPALPVLYWLVGLAVVRLLWRPASRAFFKPPGYTQAQHQAPMAELDHQAQMAEVARIRARLPRHVSD